MNARYETGKSVQQHMSATEGIVHVFMMLCTVGLWYPVYRHRKNALQRTTRYYA